MIPLPDGVMSVGAVCRPDYLKQRKGRTVEFLLETLQTATPALWQAARACRIDRQGGARHRQLLLRFGRMGGPGWVLIGDAFAFLDPVFSSGVYLAMSGAEQAAAWSMRRCASRLASAALLRKLERRQRAGMARFSFFIYRFNSPVMQRMFRAAAQYAGSSSRR